MDRVLLFLIKMSVTAVVLILNGMLWLMPPFHLDMVAAIAFASLNIAINLFCATMLVFFWRLK